MVIKLFIVLLVHLTLAFIGILMGKYIPNLVDKNDEKDKESFVYTCLLPIMNIVPVAMGIFKLVDKILRKLSNYIKRWL